MSDKFLNTGGSGTANLSNGTVNAFLAGLTVANLRPSMPVKTNSVNTLISSKLDIKDINNLESRLDNGISNPFNGTLKVNDLETNDTFSLNDELQKIDNFTASTQAPDITNITGLTKTTELATGRVYDTSQSTFIDLDGTDVNVSSNDLLLNGSSVITELGGKNITSTLTTTQTAFTLDQELITKKYVDTTIDDNVNLQNAYDRGPDILTKVGTPISITGPEGIQTGANVKVYDDVGANPYATFVSYGNIILKTDNPAQTSFGSINYTSSGPSKVLNLQVDKGNSGGSNSTMNIQVDGEIFNFTDDQLDMNNKKITELAEPTLAQDAATKNYVDNNSGNPFDQNLNTTSNVIFNTLACGAILIENETLDNNIVLETVATGDNRITSSGGNGSLEINGSNLTMNLTNGTLTENVGSNKISLITGNLTENISSSRTSTAASHIFNGALTSSTSVTTPLISGVSTITNSSNINITNIGNNLIISNSGVVINSSNGINLTGAAFGINLGANQITTTKTVFTDDQLITKKYVDDRNFQNYSFRNINGINTLPGGVPIWSGVNPIISNQYSLPHGDYYVRYIPAAGVVFVNMVLKSLSDAGTATDDDVYRTVLTDFWNIANFPSMNGGTITYNTSFPINIDTRPVFRDIYISLGWDAPDNDIELTMLKLPEGVNSLYSLAVPHDDAAASVKTTLATVNAATDIFPNGFNVVNSMLNVYIAPSSNPTGGNYPHYEILFRRVDDVIFMKLERYFIG